MKRLAIFVGLAAIVGAGEARAAGDLEVLERKVAAYATPHLTAYNKALCVCDDGTEKEGRAGRLRYAIFPSPSDTPELQVWCQVSIYDQQGDPVSSVGCWTFQPIAK
jgi:hypothetical protein